MSNSKRKLKTVYISHSPFRQYDFLVPTRLLMYLHDFETQHIEVLELLDTRFQNTKVLRYSKTNVLGYEVPDFEVLAY